MSTDTDVDATFILMAVPAQIQGLLHLIAIAAAVALADWFNSEDTSK
ncbi:hypothetical protein Harman_42030 [Haloarcula mannanilytica]|uniref:Uncharacterized protein n=1 Tax=Haloarcula mannanilytica TaxID=2509225 RepID=A0A4C2ENT1_9EURY|nr:hypothetical protein Harman_42030 [Haloarcula mannanilytica]